MNTFSKLLSTLVTEKGANISQMASCCGVDRSTMYKIVNGTRKPSSERLVKEICGFLKLSPEESSLLVEKYRIVRVGPVNYQKMKKILSFLQACFENPASPSAPAGRLSARDMSEKDEAAPSAAIENPAAPSAPAPGLPAFSLPEDSGASIPLNGEEKLLSAFEYIAQKEMCRGNGFLRLRMQPQDQFTRLLLKLSKSSCCADGFHIQHILALDEGRMEGQMEGPIEGQTEGQMPESSAQFNLDLIRSLLTALKQLQNYEIYCFHEGSREANADYSFFPCLILTGEYALQFSENLRFGILHCRPETVSLMEDVYSNLLDACFPLTKNCRDYRDALVHGKKRFLGPGAISIQPFPCMNFLLTKELLQKYIKTDLSERNFIIKAALELQERNLKFYTTRSVTIIASEKGIRNFLMDGTLPAYLTSLYLPPEPEDRLLMMSRFREMLKKCRPSFRLVKESFGKLDSAAYIWIEDNYASFLLFNRQRTCNNLFIREQDIIACFMDFFANMPDHLFFSEQESIEILDRILDGF